MWLMTTHGGFDQNSEVRISGIKPKQIEIDLKGKKRIDLQSIKLKALV